VLPATAGGPFGLIPCGLETQNDRHKTNKTNHHYVAASLPYKVRIYLYGSYVKGNKKPPSDIDIALEFCDDQLPDEPELLWFDNHDSWEEYLSRKLGISVDLELYSEDTNIPKYVAEASLLLYDASLEKGNV
jgi:predicted nucleotidyltransferase